MKIKIDIRVDFPLIILCVCFFFDLNSFYLLCSQSYGALKLRHKVFNPNTLSIKSPYQLQMPWNSIQRGGRRNGIASSTNANLPILFEFKYSFYGKYVRFSHWINDFYAILIDIFVWFTPRFIHRYGLTSHEASQNFKFISLKFMLHLRFAQLYTINYQFYSIFSNWPREIYFQHIFAIKNSSIAHKIGFISEKFIEITMNMSSYWCS